jgi:ketosteroid isomerase-like protein
MAASMNLIHSVEMDLRERDHEFERNVAAKDAATLCRDLYAADAQLLPPGAPALYGRPAIETFWRGLIEAGLTDVRLQTTEVRHVGALAYAVGAYSLAIKSEAGARVTDTGKYVYIYRREPDGGWKAVLDIFNSDGASS